MNLPNQLNLSKLKLIGTSFVGLFATLLMVTTGFCQNVDPVPDRVLPNQSVLVPANSVSAPIQSGIQAPITTQQGTAQPVLTSPIQNPLPTTGTLPSSNASQYIDDINQIRQRLGGGVANQLQGMLDTTSNEELQKDFDNQIREMATQQSNGQNRQNVPAIDPLSQKELAKRNRGILGTLPRVDPPQVRRNSNLPAVHFNRSANLSNNPSPLSKVDRYRSAARYLDLAAADLEQLELYNQADDLRRQASELRMRARQ